MKFIVDPFGVQIVLRIFDRQVTVNKFKAGGTNAAFAEQKPMRLNSAIRLIA